MVRGARCIVPVHVRTPVAPYPLAHRGRLTFLLPAAFPSGLTRPPVQPVNDAAFEYAQDKSPHEFVEEEIRLHLHDLLDLTREDRNQVIEEWRTGKPGSATSKAWETEIRILNSEIEYLTNRINRIIGLVRATEAA